MGNTWNGMTFTNIAQRGFSAFVKRLVALRAFTTDFSAEAKEQGTVVTTRVVPAAAAAKDLQTDHTGDRSKAAGDTTTTPINVTLNQQPISGFHLTDEEAKIIGSGVWNDTLSRKIDMHGYSVANHMLNYVFGLITAENFPSVAFTGGGSTFDLDDVIDINAALALAGWPVDIDGLIAMVLQPAYRGALKKDGAIQDLSKSGIDGVISRGSLDRVDIFRLYQAASLPPAGGTPAAEHLTGFVATPDALAVVQRIVEPQDQNDLMAFEVLTDDETGASIAYRAWYDRNLGKVNHTFETLYGASVAKAEALQRIRSEA
jgi:hypothetical protein